MLLQVQVLVLLYWCVSSTVLAGEYHHADDYSHHDYYQPVPHKYKFDYAVQDSHYGPNFGASESKDDYITKGSYFVDLPNGIRQRVTYYVTKDSGYVADVTYEPIVEYKKPYNIATKVVHPKPIHRIPEPIYEVPKPYYKPHVEPDYTFIKPVYQISKPVFPPRPIYDQFSKVIHDLPAYYQAPSSPVYHKPTFRQINFQEIPAPKPIYFSKQLHSSSDHHEEEHDEELERHEEEEYFEDSSSREKKAIVDNLSGSGYSYQNIKFLPASTSYSRFQRDFPVYRTRHGRRSLKELDQYNIDAAEYI